MYTLFTDTDTDITPEVAQRYGYKLISMPYIIDGVEYFPYESFKEFESHKFYDMLREGTLPSTSGLSPQKYIEYFEPEFKKGNDILYVHFSAAMSGTFDAMRLAIQDLKERYPDRNVYTVDTKGITLGSYNICLEIGELYKAGKSIEEIQEWAEQEVDKFAIYFYADDLKFFKRSGRVSGLAAFFGGMVGIKPIIYMNSEGKMVTYSKARGRQQTFQKICDIVEELQDNMRDHRVIIAHCDSLDLAEQLGATMKQRFGEDLEIEYTIVNPTAGSHCGPNACGVSFHAKHR